VFEQFHCFLNESIESRASQFSMLLKVRPLGFNAHLIICRGRSVRRVDRPFRQSSHLMHCRICMHYCIRAPLDSGASRKGLNGSEPPA